MRESKRNTTAYSYPKTKNYYQKVIIRKIFGKDCYKYFKALKVKLLYKMGRSFEISSFLQQIIEDDFIIFDIGANLGQYAIRLTRYLGEEGRVVSVEPETENYGFLIRLKNKHKLKNLVCCNYAISDFNGEAILNIPVIDNDIELDTRATIDKANYYFEYDKYVSQKVNVVTIQKLFCDLNLNKLDIIKSDTEGNDEKVILGSLELIKEYLPLILVEDSHREEWVKKLYETGYLPFYVKNKLFMKNSFEIRENESGIDYDLLMLVHQSGIGKYRKFIIE
ncbi:MAG: FkbM family methyltransferase [Ignavibacteriae bacterium]|nr:FkbM family methyltransferase [Ignavibacteriota bacterium]